MYVGLPTISRSLSKNIKLLRLLLSPSSAWLTSIQTSVRSPVFTSLLFSVFPYSKVSLLAFLQVLIQLCSSIAVLTIFTCNNRLSCQSLIPTKVWVLERQHLRLVSLETTSQRKVAYRESHGMCSQKTYLQGSWEDSTRQREWLTCNAVAPEASAHPIGSSGAEMVAL